MSLCRVISYIVERGCLLWPVHSLGEGNGILLQYSCLENSMGRGAWWVAVHGVAKSRTWLRILTFTFHFHALEKEMTTHSSVLAWRIPGMGEPGGLPSMGSHRVGYDWSDLAAAVHSLGKTLSVFVLLYFVFQGQTYLLLCVSLVVLLLWSKCCDEKKIFFFFLLLVLEGLVGHHRTIQLHLLPH